MRRIGWVLVSAILVGACSAGSSPPDWTFAPSPSTAPAGSATASPTPGTSPTHGTSPTAATTPSTGITDAELASLTWGTGERVSSSDLTVAVSAADAERVVRAKYDGERPLIWNGLVRFGPADRRQLGWMVVLGPATGDTCTYHAGLLDRALEGGIVDAAHPQIVWTYSCLS